jgi:hypothetical protein
MGRALVLYFAFSLGFSAEGWAASRRVSRNRTPPSPKATSPQRQYPGLPQPQPLPSPSAPPPRPVPAPPVPLVQPAPPAPIWPQPHPRNQNPYGQPAGNLPPHLRANEEFGGVRNWFGMLGSSFGFDTLTRTNPGVGECSANCKSTIEEPRWALQLQGAVGWGPVKRDNVSFTTHYRYTQNLRTNNDQLARFGTWFSTFKTGDFLFPTRDMLRSHELVSEIRYSATPFQLGLHGILDFERVGSSSSFLGEPNEIADSVRNMEQLTPWVQWRIPGVYISTLYAPMRTEINKEDPRTSYTTWSLKSAGRGIFFTLIQDNLFYLPKISSTAGLTLNFTNKKSASIQNDSSKWGGKASFDFPIAFNFRVQPFFKYESENFILPRIKVENTSDGTARLETRSDSILGAGGQTYVDISRNWRFAFAIAYESTQSSLSDFSGSRMSYFGGFTYSWPLSRAVLRRLDRFSDSLTAEEN